AGPLPHDVSLSLERLARTEDVHQVAVMPDVHLSGDICTGTVVATKRLLYPAAVGNDIGCGMIALRFPCEAAILAEEQPAARLLAGLYRTVPTIRPSRFTVFWKLPEVLANAPLTQPALEKHKDRDGRVEFATLGRGNHFIEFQADEQGQLWLMIHSGSRAMGQAITEYHLGQAHPSDTGLACLDAD